MNNLIETDAYRARVAVAYGWKVAGMDDPAATAVYDATAQGWFLLDDNYSREASHEH